jgi:hypothetical protein
MYHKARLEQSTHREDTIIKGLLDQIKTYIEPENAPQKVLAILKTNAPSKPPERIHLQIEQSTKTFVKTETERQPHRICTFNMLKKALHQYTNTAHESHLSKLPMAIILQKLGKLVRKNPPHKRKQIQTKTHIDKFYAINIIVQSKYSICKGDS